ncbi:azurin [Roseimicrobium gellanilyticum]|uniref:Azurin n=1 Tax=Roseimicrobium gellanilyticum TaxID=748857 RepID=A0A366HVR2_9BACT|nr:plastocyanin/azurin family copper-binding protein [Roseimicrobium gellanilyticum]RBP47388.1 azurin [Roseimicrobium gellanilyticum]
MATPHDKHQHESSGFWGCANIFIGGGFAFCALLAGGALFFGGLGQGWKGKADPEAAAASSAAPAPAAAPASAAPAVATSGDVLVVTLRPGSLNPMSWETTTITAKAGQKVKLTFENQHATAPLQHNFILGKIGSKQRLIDASNGMMSDMAKWMAAGFIPESTDVLAHTKLLNPGQSETIEFTLPAEAGEYPYICTFPGHALIMQGTLKAE